MSFLATNPELAGADLTRIEGQITTARTALCESYDQAIDKMQDSRGEFATELKAALLAEKNLLGAVMDLFEEYCKAMRTTVAEISATDRSLGDDYLSAFFANR